MNNDVKSLWLAGGTALLVTQAAPAAQAYALDSILYAQVVADKHQGSRFGDYARWYSAYRTALESCGWIVPRSNADHQRDPLLSPLRWLAERLKAAHPEWADDLEPALTRLAAHDAQQHLQPFTRREQGGSTRTVHELGVLLPGPSLLLSSLACDSDGADLRDSTCILDERTPERRQRELHERLQQKGLQASIMELGSIGSGGVHANA